MKRSVRRYGTIALVIGLVALAGGPTTARQRTGIELISAPFGITFGQVARLTAAHVGDERSPSGAADDSIIFRTQLLDTEGTVIAQSDSIRVNPGEMRFWDAPRELLPAGEASGRTQVRAKVLITASRIDVTRDRLPVETSLEVVDASTGATAYYSEIGRLSQRLITL